MKTFEGKLIERIKRTPNTESFRFLLNEKLSFFPGQFVKTLFDASDIKNQQLNKYLSFSSSPSKDYMEITKKLTESDFSRRLQALKKNDLVLFQGPLGNCVFKNEFKKIGFLAGGIGITPVISILGYIIEKGLDTDVVILYSNKSPEDIAFRAELDSWKNNTNKIKLVYFVTECPGPGNGCVHGRIDKELFTENVTDIPERVFFIFGPPVMVDAMNKLCLEAGCNKEKIMTERFIGY